jgi:hypothetical protein
MYMYVQCRLTHEEFGLDWIGLDWIAKSLIQIQSNPMQFFKIGIQSNPIQMISGDDPIQSNPMHWIGLDWIWIGLDWIGFADLWCTLSIVYSSIQCTA